MFGQSLPARGARIEIVMIMKTQTGTNSVAPRKGSAD